ncbi:MAG: 30S ribosomal protein S16 [Pirellulaceae bacterium]|nr:30S ribosomal protein S16 [Pirellulaceae bacterium]
MAVRIRMKKMGRTHRPYYRICAMDKRTPRDGRVLEELGTYDPSIKLTDARVTLNGERVDYWLSVGAQPSDKVKVFIKKYGTQGTHLESQKEALDTLKKKVAHIPVAPVVAKPKEEEASEEATPETEEKETTEAVEDKAEE